MKEKYRIYPFSYSLMATNAYIIVIPCLWTIQGLIGQLPILTGSQSGLACCGLVPFGLERKRVRRLEEEAEAEAEVEEGVVEEERGGGWGGREGGGGGCILVGGFNDLHEEETSMKWQAEEEVLWRREEGDSAWEGGGVFEKEFEGIKIRRYNCQYKCWKKKE